MAKLTNRDITTLNDLLKMLRSVRGNVARTPNGLVIGNSPGSARVTAPSVELYWVSLTGHEGCGGGKYTGTIVGPATGLIDMTMDLIASDFGADTGQKVYLLNPTEIGLTSHNLDPGYPPSYFLATPYSASKSDGVQVFRIVNFGQTEDCA